MIIHTTDDLKKKMAAGATSLGTMVFWNGLGNVRIPRSVFRTAMEDMGLGHVVGRDPKAEACMSLAAGVVVRRQGKAATPSKIQLKDKGAFATYAVLMRRDVPGAQPGQDLIQYLEEVRVVLDRRQPTPTPTIVTEPAAPDDDTRDALIADLVDEYNDTLRNVRTDEASAALSASMQALGGLTLRPGVYFVPARNAPTLESLAAFFEAHTTAVIDRWDITETSSNAATAQRSARQRFLDDVAELTRECQAFATAKGDDITTKSINARVNRFKELDGKVVLYAEILGDMATDLHGAIDAARKAFAVAIGLDDDPAAAA